MLGSSPHTRQVRSYRWDKLPPNLNVADFDAVILNLVPLENRKLARGINLSTLPPDDQFAWLVFSQGSELLVIGSPQTTFGPDELIILDRWLPGFPGIVYESGEGIRQVAPEFAAYFAQVKRWIFHATNQFFMMQPRALEHYISTVDPLSDQLGHGMRMIAQTRFGHALAFELAFEVGRDVQVGRSGGYGTEHSYQTRKRSGRVIWLPPPTEVSDYEAVDLLLRERYSLRFETEPPEWVGGYRLPSQSPIEGEIEQLEGAIDLARASLADASRRLSNVTRFLKLLYERDEALEEVVRDALRELGAQVSDPTVKGKDDGRLVDPQGRVAMLEIKGRTGALRLSDVRELHNWVSDAIAYEEWSGKGILIGNLQCDRPVGERKAVYPVDCLRTANQFNIALVTTAQIYHAMVSMQEGGFDLPGFWDTIFACSGACDLPSPA